MKVSAHFGAAPTSLRISEPSRPDSSATPAPIIATKVTPMTAKPAKLLTNDEKMKRIPSIEIRLLIGMVCSTISHSSGLVLGAEMLGWVLSS